MKKRRVAVLVQLALAGALLAGAGSIAHAEILAETEVRQVQDDTVVRIQFATRVQLIRFAPQTSSDFIEIFFQPFGPIDELTRSEETRFVRGVGTVPNVTVTYPFPQVGQPRRIVVRFNSRVSFRVRQGPSSNSIDVVLFGVSPQAQAPRPPAPAPAAPTPPIATPVPSQPRIESAPLPRPAPTPPAPAARAPAPAPAEVPPVAPDRRYIVTLQTFPSADTSGAKPVPGQFSAFDVFTSPVQRDGRVEHELNLGFFPSREEADRARTALLQRFPDARVTDLEERRQASLAAAAAAAQRAQAPEPPAPGGQTAPPSIAVPSLPPEPGAAPIPGAPVFATPPVGAPVVTAPAEVEALAQQLMARGRKALDAKDPEGAINAFNQLLILPPNSQSQSAQELIGVAREQAGELAKARAEYELYLKLFPTGADADRVRERLAKLGQRADTQAAGAGSDAGGTGLRPAAPSLRTINGTLSQYFYGGNSRVVTAFNTPTGPDRATISTVDQRTLVTNLDLSARVRTAESDNRFVLRDTDTRSFVEDVNSFNRLNALFYDYRGLANSWQGRVGRQTGFTGGVPTRYDGANVGYSLTPNWRVNAVAGTPVEYPKINSQRWFAGVNADFENLGGRWSGDLYGINAMVDGILDRRAVGGEVRYFDDTTSMYSLLDYDVSYNVPNITTLQGSWQSRTGTTFNALYDRRRAPSLATTNAVYGQPTTSISQLLLTVSEDQLREQALAITAIATQGLLGVTQSVTEKWQVGFDARYTNVGALPATEINGIQVPAQPATGNIWSYQMQAIGTNLYSARDFNVFGATYLTGPTYDGWLYSYNNVTRVGERWTLEPSLRFYRQNDIFENNMRRLTPGLRLTYFLRQNFALEFEMASETTRTTGPAADDRTQRYFWYVGYRADM